MNWKSTCFLLLMATLFSNCSQKINPIGSILVKNLGNDMIISNYTDTISQKPAMICNKFNVPTTLNDLNQHEIYSSNITLNVGASLSLFGFSGNMEKKDVLIAAYFVSFKDFHCDDNSTIRTLVGIRLFVHATSLKVGISSPTLTQIAAAVQLGLAKSEYKFQIIGLPAGSIYSQLPSAQFDVDTYSKVISSYDNILHSLTSTTPIDPILNAVSNDQIKFIK